ncbi:MAG: DsbA family protein, partial [Pseudomonadota bacterium]
AIYPAKGKNMWRDMERRADKYGIAFKRPSDGDTRSFPQNGLLAARTALGALHEPWGKDYVKRVYQAQFVEGHDIANPDIIGACIEAAGGVAHVYLKMAHANAQKAHLRENTDAAIDAGIYGAPSFTVGDELFWGDDRLEDALDWATRAP